MTAVAIPNDPALLEEVVRACEDRGLVVWAEGGELHGAGNPDAVADALPWVLRELGYVEADTLATPRKPRYQDRQVPVIRRRR